MMAVIILGVLEVTHQRDHFAVDLLTNVAPKPVRRLMNIFADIMMLVIMYVMTFGSYQMVVLNWENRTPAIGLPSWLPYGLLLFSSAISILYLLLQLLSDLGLNLEKDHSKEGGSAEC